MKYTKRHLTTNIDFLLKQTDEWLSNVFDGDGKDFRKDLQERRDKGELLIGSEGCEGFDPIKGCPGHEVTN